MSAMSWSLSLSREKKGMVSSPARTTAGTWPALRRMMRVAGPRPLSWQGAQARQQFAERVPVAELRVQTRQQHDGLPAAALFHRATSLDLLLPRLLCGERFTPETVAPMALGGLAQPGADQHLQRYQQLH